MKRYQIKCSSPDCANKIVAHKGEICFCKKCRDKHGKKALRLQHTYNKPIKDIIIETARRYNTGIGVVDSLEITHDTLWRWLKKYFNVSNFSLFKTLYVCKTDECYSLNVSDFKIGVYNFVYYLGKKDVCACVLGDVVMVKVRSLITKRRIEEVMIGREPV